jgi:hypothetical protein
VRVGEWEEGDRKGEAEGKGWKGPMKHLNPGPKVPYYTTAGKRKCCPNFEKQIHFSARLVLFSNKNLISYQIVGSTFNANYAAIHKKLHLTMCA